MGNRLLFPGWLIRLATSRPLHLAVLAALLLWPGITRLPPLDRAESRTAAATAHLLETGNIASPETPRDLPSAAIIGLQAGAVALLSPPPYRDIAANRVPGALAAVAAVLLTRHIAAVLYGPAAGTIAALLLAFSGLLGAGARMATADAPLLAVVLLAQAALLEAWRRRDLPPTAGDSWFSPGLFWAANGVGLILAGPAILLFTFGTLLGLAVAERQARWMVPALRPRLGIALMLAIVLLWVSVIAPGSGGGFFSPGPPGYWAPPGSYLVLFVLTFWPGSLFAARSLSWVWSSRRAPETRFLLAWIVPAWVVLEAMAEKLPLDVLPVYPAIAALTAGAICAPGGWRQRPPRWIERKVVGGYDKLWMLVGTLLAAAGPVLLLWLGPHLVALAALAGLIAGVLMVHARRQAQRPAPRTALACAGAAAVVLSLSLSLLVLPGLETIWLSPRIAAAVRTLRPCPDSVLASASYAEPSLLYLAGPATKLIGPAEAAAFLHDQPACGLALIGTADDAAFLSRAKALGLTPRPLTRIEGIDYPARSRLVLTLYVAR